MSIDVQSTVESPEVYILGRSSSSLEDQALFSACRNECINTLHTPLLLSNGTKILDVLRFFHGDGPAQQFEAGNSVGGAYFCVGCGVNWNRVYDIAYASRCELKSLQQRQDFLLQGVAWKDLTTRPLDKLLLADLQKELNLRGIAMKGKKKAILEQAFDDIRMGITNFPALLQSSPEASLQSLNLQQYEVAPTEPLHDLKGHFANIIEETFAVTTGDTHKILADVKASLLSKETVRCSDLRKAIILIYLKLEQLKPDDILTNLYRTAVDISNLCYAHEEKRVQRSILCLHNRTFLHAYYCSVLFSNPKSMSRRRMFGRYFHSLTTHASLLLRIISLRSLNAEQHERMFQKAKGITKATSNNHAQQVITNIIQRLQFEEGAEGVIASQESQVKSFSLGVGPMKNTFIPTALLHQIPDYYQSHLERIGDYLLCGPGVWWRQSPDGIEFMDGDNEPDSREAERASSLIL